MNVGLNEAGKNRATLGVDYDVGRLACFADARNAAIMNEQIARHDGVLVIHRQESAAFNENRFHSRTGIPACHASATVPLSDRNKAGIFHMSFAISHLSFQRALSTFGSFDD